MQLKFVDKNNSSSPTIILKNDFYVYKIGFNHNYLENIRNNDMYGVLYEANVYEYIKNRDIKGNIIPLMIKKCVNLGKIFHILGINDECKISRKIKKNLIEILDENTDMKNELYKKKYVLLKFHNMYNKKYKTLREYLEEINNSEIQNVMIKILKKLNIILKEYKKIKLLHNDIRSSNIFVKLKKDKDIDILLYDFDRSHLDIYGKNLACIDNIHINKYTDGFDLYKFICVVLKTKLFYLPYDKNMIFYLLFGLNPKFINKNFYDYFIKSDSENIYKYMKKYNSIETIDLLLKEL